MANNVFTDVATSFAGLGGTFDDVIDKIYQAERTQALEDREYNAMREDTAYQRAVKDLEAAGLNPWLATGNPASSQAISNVSQATSKMREVGQNYMELFEKTIKDQMDISNDTSSTAVDNMYKIGKLIMPFLMSGM